MDGTRTKQISNPLKGTGTRKVRQHLPTPGHGNNAKHFKQLDEEFDDVANNGTDPLSTYMGHYQMQVSRETHKWTGSPRDGTCVASTRRVSLRYKPNTRK